MYKPFEQVIVMDPCALTGIVFCDLVVSTGLSDTRGLLVQSIPDLFRTLDCFRESTVLVITEFRGLDDRMTRGLAMLRTLRLWQDSGKLKTMVCTDIDDPMMLKAIVNCGPTVLSMRRESLPILIRAMRHAAEHRTGQFKSPGVNKRLSDYQGEHLTSRQLEWLMTQVDGMDAQQSSLAMGVCSKTVYAWRLTLTKKLGGARAWQRYLSRLQQCMVHNGLRQQGQ